MILKEIPSRVIAARSITVFPDDTFIVSYPRSGNTWVRFLIGNLVNPSEPVGFADIEKRVPDIYRNNNSELQTIPRPRLLKSHEYVNARYSRVIYIVRDPRDVAVSYYHYHLKQRWVEDGHGLDRFVQDFVAGDLLYGAWNRHVSGWLQSRQENGAFLLIHYETMLVYPEIEVRKIAHFLGINTTQQDIDRALDLSSAINMRRLEQDQSNIWRTTQLSRKDIPFVRVAKAGQWRSELSRDSAQLIESAWRQLMEDFHYL